MNKLNSGFSKLPDEQFDNKAQTIAAALTGNTNFLTTDPPLATITASITAYQAALALPPGVARDAQVAATRDTLGTQLERLARSLELVPNVTEAMLATTGFDLRKTPSFSSEELAAPADVRLKQAGVTGVVQVLCDPVARAESYELQYTLDPNNGPWIDAGTFSSTRGLGLTGLTRAKDYWARVRGIGPSGAGAWSDPATILVA